MVSVVFLYAVSGFVVCALINKTGNKAKKIDNCFTMKFIKEQK